MEYLLKEVNCMNFINADMIANALSPFNPAAAQVKAGKLFLKELDEYIERKESFCFETTLSGVAYLNKIKRWRDRGWLVYLHYLWIPDAEFSGLRVAERVAQGGHDIPAAAIRRRYRKSLCNLFKYLEECDQVLCYDNSILNAHRLIFAYSQEKLEICDVSMYESLRKEVQE